MLKKLLLLVLLGVTGIEADPHYEEVSPFPATFDGATLLQQPEDFEPNAPALEGGQLMPDLGPDVKQYDLINDEQCKEFVQELFTGIIHSSDTGWVYGPESVGIFVHDRNREVYILSLANVLVDGQFVEQDYEHKALISDVLATGGFGDRVKHVAVLVEGEPVIFSRTPDNDAPAFIIDLKEKARRMLLP